MSEAFAVWVETVPDTVRQDPLWRVTAYRLALYVADLGWDDVGVLMKDRRTRALADQLYRALGSIGANIAEGYSRGTGRDRARFYEYALGSAREARTWYFNARYLLGIELTKERMRLLTRIIQLTLKMVPQQRGHHAREPEADYATTTESTTIDETTALTRDG